MILTQKEQDDIGLLCKNTMRFTSQHAGPGILGAIGGSNTLLIELRRSVAGLDNIKTSSDKHKLHTAFDKFEASLQAVVTMSNGAATLVGTTAVTPEEIESILATLDEMRKKHGLFHKKSDKNKVFVTEEVSGSRYSSVFLIKFSMFTIATILYVAFAAMWPWQYLVTVGPEVSFSSSINDCSVIERKDLFRQTDGFGIAIAATVSSQPMNENFLNQFSTQDVSSATRCGQITTFNLIGVVGNLLIYIIVLRLFMADRTLEETDWSPDDTKG